MFGPPSDLPLHLDSMLARPADLVFLLSRFFASFLSTTNHHQHPSKPILPKMIVPLVALTLAASSLVAASPTGSLPPSFSRRNEDLPEGVFVSFLFLSFFSLLPPRLSISLADLSSHLFRIRAVLPSQLFRLHPWERHTSFDCSMGTSQHHGQRQHACLPSFPS